MVQMVLPEQLSHNDEDEVVISVPRQNPRKMGILKVIWHEMTAGVGMWGSLRPIVTLLLALIPFLFIGQHFNRQHRKAFDWSLFQIPLLLTIVWWPALYLYSLFDAWHEATEIVAQDAEY